MAINVNINVSNLGAAVLSQNNPAAQSWIRVETNGAITLRTAAETLSDLGAQAAGAYVTAVTASGNIASSGGTTPNITFTGVLPIANGGTGVNIGTTALTLGTASTTAGQLTLSNATNAFTQTIRGTNPAASIIYDLPTTAPTASQVLSATAPAAGVVTLSWATVASGITIGGTAISGGADNRILFQDATASDFVTQIANFTMGAVATGILDVPVGYAIAGVQIGRASTQATKWGYGAGFSTGGTYYSTFIGAYSGANVTSDHLNSVAVGTFSMRYGRAGTSSGVAIGYQAGQFIDEQEVAIGYRAGYNGGATTGVGPAFGTFVGCYSGYNATASGYYNCFFGNSSGLNITSGASNIFIGASAGSGATVATVSSSAGFGREAICLQSNILVFGSLNYPYTNIYFNGEAGATVRPVTLHGSHGSGTNISGSDFGIDGGNATGTAAGGNLKWTTSVKRASGTTVQSSTDRHAIIGKYVDITESAATTYGTLALTTSGTIAGGTIIYTIEANDGTDYQSLTGNAVYSVVNKAGTLTVTFTDLTQALAESAGGSTLTSTMTATVSGTSVQFQANAVSSLAQTTLRISFQVLNNFGVAIISPA